jgi:phospholipid-binding lipoprotein MlaA
MRFLAPLFLSLATLVAGCATTGERDPKDPWEGFNRGVFSFNEGLDRAVLKPVATGYQKVVPGFAREGVTNFYANLEDVGTSLNNFLQGKPKEGASDAGRVIVNTLLGVLGLWDVATPMGLEKHYEDFGQTLGVWGVGPGPYLVLPLLGPSTARDGPAKVVDPAWYWPIALENDRLYWSLWALDKVNQRSILFQSEKVLDEAALDRYSFIRDAWWQRRQNQVYDGNPPRPKEEE